MPPYENVFSALREILRPYEPELAVVEDSTISYYLNCRKPRAKNKDMFFGAVQVKKRYVSYHLMPLYVFPQLLDGLSPALRKRMQGKSCFHFTRIDPDLLDELRVQTRRGLQRFRESDML